MHVSAHSSRPAAQGLERLCAGAASTDQRPRATLALMLCTRCEVQVEPSGGFPSLMVSRGLVMDKSLIVRFAIVQWALVASIIALDIFCIFLVVWLFLASATQMSMRWSRSSLAIPSSSNLCACRDMPQECHGRCCACEASPRRSVPCTARSARLLAGAQRRRPACGRGTAALRNGHMQQRKPCMQCP